MDFENDLVGHFVIWNNFSKKRINFSFCMEYPFKLSPKWAEKISVYQKSDLIPQNGQTNLIRITPKTSDYI